MRIEIEITPEPPGPLLPASACNEVAMKLIAGEQRGEFPWYMSHETGAVSKEKTTREIVHYTVKWGILA